MEKTEKITNPWAVYGISLDLRVGKVSEEGNRSVHILYSEGQFYSAELWDSEYVKRFATPLEAINDASTRGRGKKFKLLEWFAQDFPSDAKLASENQ